MKLYTRKIKHWVALIEDCPTKGCLYGFREMFIKWDCTGCATKHFLMVFKPELQVCFSCEEFVTEDMGFGSYEPERIFTKNGWCPTYEHVLNLWKMGLGKQIGARKILVIEAPI